MKRALRAAVLLLLAFMLLAGCGKKNDTAGGESSGAGTELPYSESASAAAETQTPTEAPTEEHTAVQTEENTPAPTEEATAAPTEEATQHAEPLPRPLPAETVAGSYSLSGTAYASGNISFDDDATEQPAAFTLTVHADGQGRLALQVLGVDGSVSDASAAYDPATGETERFKLELWEAVLRFREEEDGVLAGLDAMYSDEQGSIGFKVSGYRTEDP